MVWDFTKAIFHFRVVVVRLHPTSVTILPMERVIEVNIFSIIRLTEVFAKVFFWKVIALHAYYIAIY